MCIHLLHKAWQISHTTVHVLFLLKIKGYHFPGVGLNSRCCIKSYRLDGIKISKSEINAVDSFHFEASSQLVCAHPLSMYSCVLLCIQDWEVSPLLWEDLKYYQLITPPSALLTPITSAKPVTRSCSHWCLGLQHMNLGARESQVQGHPWLYTSARLLCGDIYNHKDYRRRETVPNTQRAGCR